MSTNLKSLAKDYERIAQAIHYLETRGEEQPELIEVAEHVGLSASHFQRLFSRWAGISPKRFLQYLTLQHTKQILRDSAQSLLDTTHAAGLSSVSRLHDLYIHCEAVTPAEYRAMGSGLNIQYGIHPTPFGPCLLAATDRGLCSLLFIHAGEDKAIAAMQRNWPKATFELEPARTKEISERIFSTRRMDQPLYAVIKGTPFQLKVWEALLSIPMGKLISYQQVARTIHHPRATRAVANAVASNPLHFLIPCHRVIQSSGVLGGYRAGPLRKKLLLGWEAAKTEEVASAA